MPLPDQIYAAQQAMLFCFAKRHQGEAWPRMTRQWISLIRTLQALQTYR